MKLMKFVKNAKGVGLVEVMMAVAISGGLALTIAKLMDNAGQNAKQIEAKSENTNLKGVLQDVLNNTTACSNTFGTVMTPANVTTLSGSPTATVTVPNIKDKVNAIKYSTASTNINPLTITSMDITNYSAAAQTGDLVVQSTFRKSSSMVMMVKPIKIPINFSFVGGAFSTCSTMAVGGEWLLGGNAGTVDGTDYIGTSDATPINFRVNAQKSGRVDMAGRVSLGYQAHLNQDVNNDGTAIGYRALMNNTTATNNTAVGWEALKDNTTGYSNTGLGNRALQANTTGYANTAVGQAALPYNTTGYRNTAIGDAALAINTSGNMNAALGHGTLAVNLVGNNNTAIGHGSLNRVTSNYNTSVGSFGMWAVSTGTNNTGIGYNNMNTMTTGSYNTALGDSAGSFTTVGSYNTMVGSSAGAALRTGSNNIFIGSNSGTGVLSGSNKLYIDSTTNTTSLIGADFSARTINLAGTTTFDVAAYGITMKLPNLSAIRTTAPATTDKIYFDTRTLFRDATSGGSGFVGIAGGLGIGSGSYWDGSAVPGQGDVNIEGEVAIGTLGGGQAKLHVTGQHPSYNTTIRATATPANTGGNAVYGEIVPINDNGTYNGLNGLCRNASGTVSAYCTGVQGVANYNASQTSGRTYGVRGFAGNGTSGWNYGVYGAVNYGTNMGAGIYGTQDSAWSDIDMTAYSAAIVAGFFKGNAVITGSLRVAATTYTSDGRLKKDIEPLEGSLEKILKIRGVSYRWKKSAIRTDDKTQEIGVIAQEVEKQFPQVVAENKVKGGYEKSVNYPALVAPLIEAVKELYAKILALVSSDEKQNIEIKALKDENAKLRADMKAQQAAFDARLKKLEAK